MTENLKLERVDRDFPYMKELRHLYKHSFPKSERKPFGMILEGAEEGKMELFAMMHETQLAGLAFFIPGEQAVVLDYLAVDPDLRSKGIGAWLLQQAEGLYDKPVVVEIEDTKHGGEEQRRRKDFYLRNGMIDDECQIRLFGVDMELLSSQRKISYEEYESVLKDYFGRELGLFLKRK